MDSGSLIVMMTDFGTELWYDAVLKGEILSRAPQANILDLSHHVHRHSVEQGAFILHCAIDSFPRKTIFCCVVDPGVGSQRRGLVGWVGQYGYVGPDNGLATPLLERAGEYIELHEIKSQTFRKNVVSPTFHGRDIFAPAAARLWLGDDPRMAGPRVTDPRRLPGYRAVDGGKRIEGRVMLIDNFGNAITSIDQATFGEKIAGATKVEIKSRTFHLSAIDTFYDQKKPGDSLAYWGSSGFLELAVNFGSAAEQFGIGFGDPVTIAYTA